MSFCKNEAVIRGLKILENIRMVTAGSEIRS